MDNLQEMKDEIRGQVDDWIEENMFGEDDRTLATVMLASMFVGTGVKHLADFAGTTQKSILQWHRNLRKSGVFGKDGMIHAEWLDEETGGLSFVLDLGVATGNTVRHKKKEDGEYHYSITDKGTKMVEEMLHID